MEKIDNKELISLFFTASRLIREKTAGHGTVGCLSIAQLKILSVISERGNPTMKEIADSLFITSPSATSAIDHLVEEGQLKRIPDSEDRRVIRLELTESGKKVFKEGYKQIVAKISEVLDKLDTKEKEFFASIFTKIINCYKK